MSQSESTNTLRKGNIALILQRIYILYHPFLLAIISIISINSLLNIDTPIHFVLVISILTHGMVYIFHRYKKETLFYFILIACILVGLIIRWMFEFSYIEIVSNSLFWLREYSNFKDEFILSYSLLLISGVSVLVFFITFYIHFIKYVTSFVSIMLLSSILVLGLQGKELELVILLSILLYICPEIIKLSNRLIGKKRENLIPQFLVIYLILSFTSVYLPYKEDPMEWTFVGKIIETSKEIVDYMDNLIEYFTDKEGKDYRFSMIGYSENGGELQGGTIKKRENKVVITMPSHTRMKSNGYLIGSIYDIYTGKGFIKSEKEDIVLTSEGKEISGVLLDGLDFTHTLSVSYDNGLSLNNLLDKKRLEISYKNIRTRSRFQIGREFPKEEELSDRKKTTKDIYQVTVQGNYRYDKSKGSGHTYEVEVYDLNLQNLVLHDLLRENQRSIESSTKDSWNKVNMGILNKRDFVSFETYANFKAMILEREERIRDRYTQLSDTVTNRTKELAYAISKEYSNDYDKLKAIETYLSEYEYSFDVVGGDDGLDMVDYFLFEGKKGYCVYYAAAMVVLARCLEIPTRYVEGFVNNYKTLSDEEVPRYEIYNENAHGWVEAYFSGIGWISFEPTKGFYENRYSGWRDYTINDTRDEPIIEQDIREEMFASYEEALELPKFMEVVEEEEEKENSTPLIIGITVILFLLILLLIGVFYNCILLRNYEKRYDRSSNNQQVQLLMKEIFLYMYLEGHKSIAGTTLHEYSTLYQDKIWNYQAFLVVLQIFMKSRYGGKEASEGEMDFMQTYKLEYKDFLKEKSGKIQYRILKFFFINLRYHRL